jgi:hypothetical protein
MSRIHCLGGGLVGSFVTNRLVSSGHEVHLFDIQSRDTDAMMHVGDALEADHSTAELIVNMLPGSIGHKATKSLSMSGHKIVDLSFSEVTPDTLEGVTSTILWDVGIAPGLSNMLVAQAYRDWGKLDEVSIKVGGNPSESDGEWSYMAPFSPHDVIAEYTRPARIIRNGMRVEVPAMTELHGIDASGRGMEAFLTDGLRSLLNIPCENMGEYTVRWPGHIQLYQTTELSPDDLVSKWAFDSERDEFTWMEIFVRNSDESRLWVIEDSGLNDDSSMARTTGIVTAQCAIAWLDRPDMLPPGVHAPEDLPDEVIELVIDVMRSEGISIELK